jgi:hypothetical protein
MESLLVGRELPARGGSGTGDTGAEYADGPFIAPLGDGIRGHEGWGYRLQDHCCRSRSSFGGIFTSRKVSQVSPLLTHTPDSQCPHPNPDA